MIKQNELRIGNLVYWGGDLLVKVIAMNFRYGDETYDFMVKKIGTPWIYEVKGDRKDGLFGIPLTPEILEKYKIKGKHFCDKFFIETNLSGVLIGHRPYGVKYLCHINYLHQFQNLYFVLTGEELTEFGETIPASDSITAINSKP